MNDTHEPTVPGIPAGDLIVEALKECPPADLQVIANAARHHSAAAHKFGCGGQAAFWAVIAAAADTWHSIHPELLTDADRADLDALGDASGQS